MATTNYCAFLKKRCSDKHRMVWIQAAGLVFSNHKTHYYCLRPTVAPSDGHLTDEARTRFVLNNSFLAPITHLIFVSVLTLLQLADIF
jgi:hypothetical protein